MKKLVTLLLSCMLCSSTFAASSPYPVDSDTLHLWHFDALANGTVLDMVESNPKNLTPANGLTLTDSQAGFGNAVNTYDGDAVSQVYIGDYANKILISELSGTDGAFTFEAIVKPMVAQDAVPHHMEILTLEDDDANTERGFQFRINDNGQLRFQTIAGIIVSFDATISFTADTWYHVAVTYNGQENTADNIKLYWTEIGSATSAQEVGSYQLTEDLKSDVSSFFCVGNELRANGGFTENFEGLVDEVRISSIARSADDMLPISSIPWANNPAPVPGEKLETMDAISELQWNTAELDNVSQHYLYICKDEPNFVDITPVTVTDLTDPITESLPISLESDSLYFWRVDESISNSAPTDAATVTGPIWVFETPPSIPIILNAPESLRVFDSEAAASLACKFSSLSEPTVQWYKVGDTNPLSAGGNISISISQDGSTYTSTLQIATPSISDEGEYYCEITNSADTVSSDNAYLIIKRLLAQYDFENTLAPTAGEADAPTGIGKSMAGLVDPNELQAADITLDFETGFDSLGQAVVIDADEFIDFSTEGYPKAGAVDGGLGLGMDAGTFVCWIKPTSIGILYQNFNDGNASGISASLEADSSARIYVRSENNHNVEILGKPDRPEYDIFDGNWHMFAFTWEAGKTSTVYVDGQPVASGSTANNTPFAQWQYSVLLGAGRQTANRQFLQPEFAASVDYLRIYNYKLDEETNDVFAQEYLDATGIVPCLNVNFDGVQYNFDNSGSSYCRIDLADFAVFAASWLDDGLFDAQ